MTAELLLTIAALCNTPSDSFYKSLALAHLQCQQHYVTCVKSKMAKAVFGSESFVLADCVLERKL